MKNFLKPGKFLKKNARAFYLKLATSPKRDMFLFTGVLAVVWIVQCALCQTMLPTDTKEAISWGARWEWGYYKHPPLAAHLAWLFSFAGGHRDWALYCAAQLCILCGVYFIYRLAREFFDERRAAMAALGLYFIYYYNPSPMNFNPNFVEIALLPATTCAFYRTLRAPSITRWVGVGVLGGLTVLGKYSGGILLFSLFLLMLVEKEYRKQFFSAGPFVAAGVFLLILSPHFYWLVKHDFLSVRYLDESIARDGYGFFFIFEILGMTLYPFAMAAAAYFGASLPRNRWKKEVPVRREALLWSAIPCLVPALIFLLIAVKGGNVIATWFFSLTLWAPIAVIAVWPWHMSRKCFRRFFLILVAFSAVMIVAVTLDAVCKARARLHLKSEDLRQIVEAYWHRYTPGEIPCVVGEGEIAYAIENYFPNRPPAAEWEDAPSMAYVRPILQKKGGLLITFHREDCEFFLRTMCRADAGLRVEAIQVPYRARWSDEKIRTYFVSCLPPGSLVE